MNPGHIALTHYYHIIGVIHIATTVVEVGLTNTLALGLTVASLALKVMTSLQA